MHTVTMASPPDRARTVSHGRLVWLVIVETAFIANAVSCLIDWSNNRLGTPLMAANVAIAIVTPIVLTVCRHLDPPPTWCGQFDDVYPYTTKETLR